MKATRYAYSVGRQLLGDVALERTLEAYDEGSN